MDVQDRINLLLERQTAPLIEGILLTQNVVLCQRHTTANPGSNEVFFVVLDGNHQAFHKPFPGVNVPLAQLYGQDPDSVPLNECAAWRLASGIGGLVTDVVTPCILRSISGTAGSLIAHRAGMPLTHEPFLVAPDQCRAAAFFDSLIAQQDRHMKNFRWDPHTTQLGLIDHGFAFAAPGWRFNSSSFVEWRHQADDPQLSDWELASLEQLRTSGDLHGLAGILTPEQADALDQRATRMLSSGELLPLGDW